VKGIFWASWESSSKGCIGMLYPQSMTETEASDKAHKRRWQGPVERYDSFIVLTYSLPGDSACSLKKFIMIGVALK
jgi:hypothetical protein